LPIFLHEIMRLPANLSVGIGFLSAYVLNFVMLRSFVFRSSSTFRSDAMRYFPINAVFRFTEYFFFLILHSGIGINYIVANLTILTISTFVKFFSYRRLFSRQI
jgi:putative flippase GtrA